MKKTLLAISCLLTGILAFAQPVTTTFNYTGSVQTFTVPTCVTSITIEAHGAQGGAVTAQSPFPQGGLGATMIGDFTVAPGDVLSLVVGGRGNSDPSSSGGGGGSGVNLNGTALIVAGGGAGVDFQDPTFAGQDAVITSDGVTGNGGGGIGGTAGSAGGNNVYSGNNISQGGNGWNDGNSGSTGLSGTSPNTTFTSGTWGLGGGGGSVGYGWCNCGGGGGGYSGGGSGQINQTGGGGGSYNIGTNQNNTPGINTGDGLIIITYTAGSGPPTTPGTISGSASVCANSTNLTYSISPVAGATGYTWTVPAGSTISSGQGTSSIIMQPGSTGGTISVTADNNCGSSLASTLTYTVNPLPVVNLGSDMTQCGGTVMLDAQNSGSSYLWSDASTSQMLTVSASGTYSVVVTDANGCSGSDGINITINPIPTVTGAASTNNACIGDADVALTGTPSGGTWSGTGVSGNSFSPTTAGTGSHTLSYTYTDINSCTNTATTVVTVNICTGTASMNLSNGINIFPNPNNGQFTLAVNADLGDLTIVISDLQGRVIYSSDENNVHAGYVKQINLDNQSAGIYFMKISGGGELRTDKISVQK